MDSAETRTSKGLGHVNVNLGTAAGDEVGTRKELAVARGLPETVCIHNICHDQLVVLNP